MRRNVQVYKKATTYELGKCPMTEEEDGGQSPVGGSKLSRLVFGAPQLSPQCAHYFPGQSADVHGETETTVQSEVFIR